MPRFRDCAILCIQNKYERCIMTLGKCVVSAAWFFETNIPKYCLKWFVLQGMSCKIRFNSPEEICYELTLFIIVIMYILWHTKNCLLQRFVKYFGFDLIDFQQNYKQFEPLMFKQNLLLLLESKTTLFSSKGTVTNFLAQVHFAITLTHPYHI